MARLVSSATVLLLPWLEAALPLPPVSPEAFRAELEEIAHHESKKYNCTVGIAVRNVAGHVAVARGTVASRPARASDWYPFGSITKMLTAASIMRLVADGALALDDNIGPLVDPLLAKMAVKDPAQNFSSVSDLWGEPMRNVTLRELLGMQSGVPDFDTATPMEGYRDPLRAALYATPNRLDTPIQLMSFPWVRDRWEDCRPMERLHVKFCYSSTNFMLLGLVLAAHAGESSWRTFNQSKFLPGHLRSEIRFPHAGSPQTNGVVPGYDRTSYNMPEGQHNDASDWDVAGVFAGWTASNLVATTQGVTDLTWEIFGPPDGIAPRKFTDQMRPARRSIYGLGSHNIGFQTGHMGEAMGEGYGHMGATYGYQSVTAYFPFLNFAMTVATNIETNSQNQPADAVCLAYNAIAGILLNRTFLCTYKEFSYEFGICRCQERAREVVV